MTKKDKVTMTNEEIKEGNKTQCPEFPYFGAKYPDARCIERRWEMTNKKTEPRYYNLTAIAKPRSTKAYFEYMTKCSSAEFFYGKTKTGSSRLDYALVELRYFSMN